MRINTLFYCLWQGIKNTFKNKWFTLASVATISACLFLFSLFYAILTNFQHMVKTAEEGVSVTVFFDEGIGDERIAEIGEMIKKRAEVREVNYVSAEDAWNTFKDEYLGEYSDGFTENPLEDCANYEIYMNDVSMQPALVKYLESIDGVRKINQSALTAQTLTGVNAIIKYVSIGIIAILFAVSIFLISNTVTIGISVRKEESAACADGRCGRQYIFQLYRRSVYRGGDPWFFVYDWNVDPAFPVCTDDRSIYRCDSTDSGSRSISGSRRRCIHDHDGGSDEGLVVSRLYRLPAAVRGKSHLSESGRIISRSAGTLGTGSGYSRWRDQRNLWNAAWCADRGDLV